MKIIKNEIRPIGFLTVELSESELQVITSVFEEICYIKNIPFERMNGTRQILYDKFIEQLKVTQ